MVVIPRYGVLLERFETIILSYSNAIAQDAPLAAGWHLCRELSLVLLT